MAQCHYCGHPADPIIGFHPECHEQHERAIEMIPGLFTKVLDSPISAERFGALLVDAAEASYVRFDELQRLCLEGMPKLLTAVLEQGLPAASEQQRIRAIQAALARVLPEETNVDETMEKIEILRDLGEGKVPDRVTVEGPMPIKLRQGETVLWIFNKVQAVRLEASKSTSAPSISIPVEDNTYFGPSAYSATLATAPDIAEDEFGDLVLTNYNIHFLTLSGLMSRIPHARIAGLQPYANALDIRVMRKKKEIVTAYVVSDPWFLGNAVARLMQVYRRRAPQPMNDPEP
jgi:hypothetical protein